MQLEGLIQFALSGSRGKPCAVAEGVREGAGGVVPEHSHGVAVWGSQTLPAERLEQACRGKCQPLRAPRPTWGSGGCWPHAEEDFSSLGLESSATSDSAEVAEP